MRSTLFTLNCNHIKRVDQDDPRQSELAEKKNEIHSGAKGRAELKHGWLAYEAWA